MRALALPLSLALSCVVGCTSEAITEEEGSRTDALTAPRANEIAFGRDASERITSVPIQSNQRDFRVVFSVPVDDLRADETLAVRGEVTLSTCVPSEGAPCKRVTPFDPRFITKIVLAGSANDASGVDLTDARDTTCNRREHHCTLVLGEATKKGFTGSKFVNLVVAAEGKGATNADLMKVEEKHGGVYVTRLGAGADPGGRTVKLDDVSGGSMKIDNVDDNGGSGRRDAHVTYRAKIAVVPGAVLDVDGIMVAKVDDGSCDPLIMNQVFVTKDRTDDPEKGALLALTAQNGTNCLGSSCTYRKSGAGELPKDAPREVWVSVVSKAGRSCAAAGDKWSVGNGSSFTVRVRH